MAATCARFIAIQRQKHAAGTFQLPARSIKRSTKVDSFSGSQFNWPMAIETQRSNPMEVITLWPHMPNLIQLVQGTEHGSVSDLIAFCP
jgi:hypothetical protein